jgi:hypothetical protein
MFTLSLLLYIAMRLRRGSMLLRSVQSSMRLRRGSSGSMLLRSGSSGSKAATQRSKFKVMPEGPYTPKALHAL